MWTFHQSYFKCFIFWSIFLLSSVIFIIFICHLLSFPLNLFSCTRCGYYIRFIKHPCNTEQLPHVSRFSFPNVSLCSISSFKGAQIWKNKEEGNLWIRKFMNGMLNDQFGVSLNFMLQTLVNENLSEFYNRLKNKL